MQDYLKRDCTGGPDAPLPIRSKLSGMLLLTCDPSVFDMTVGSGPRKFPNSVHSQDVFV